MSAERILIVDDDDDILLIVQTILTSAGYSTSLARNGREGVDMALDVHPDLILVDRSLLDREGLEILSQLTRKWSESEIIFLPESLNSTGAAAAFAPQLLRNVDRLLKMRSTREILAV